MTSDGELLRRYAEANSEEAFGELVRRHVNLVYSAALRQVNGDTHLAQDVAQSVFTDLARKAESLTGRRVLAGWLYAGTHFAAAKAVRIEHRRQTREQEAQLMHELLQDSTPERDWRLLRPTLDAAMLELNETDREAVLLRYFDNRPHAEIADRLGLSENAARMRVDRALEKLRTLLSGRGVTTTAALSAVISANAVQAAPVGLAVTISTAAALAGTTIATTATVTVTKAIAMTTLQKTLVTATVAVLAGVGIYEARQASQLRDQLQTLQQHQAPLAAQIQQLQREYDEATNRLGTLADEKELQRLRKEHLELLSLRGRVGQLANELRGQKANQAKNTDTKTNPENADSDSILFSASLTNRVAGGQTLVLGGWSKVGMRSYLLLTPAIPQSGNSPDAEQLTVQSQMVGAPESFWAQIGWADAKSESRRSTLASVLTRDQLETLLQALKETKDGETSNTSPATGRDGERIGFGWSMADDNQSGMLMGIDLYPRITADRQSVDFEIRPSALSSNTPIHPSLKPAGQPVAPSGP